MVSITKGITTVDGKVPVTLLVEDVETANILIKMARDAKVPVIEQEDKINKSGSNNKAAQDKIKNIIKNKTGGE